MTQHKPSINSAGKVRLHVAFCGHEQCQPGTRIMGNIDIIYILITVIYRESDPVIHIYIYTDIVIMRHFNA